ncbi:hypothetical protein LVJ83_00140 [Uruburuella testudinis]|uniref:Uncharacterized protein n=1 Tax=Uruburuella testudinis TaxID=1282863 RepID=A0ABY4DWF1_9NEIS|nr:hypothetical protein [Uruburuella testudinis]UOO81927.1 hypothetical protein LVJ83_00140 [Uruburuella testudinis]
MNKKVLRHGCTLLFRLYCLRFLSLLSSFPYFVVLPLCMVIRLRGYCTAGRGAMGWFL